MGTKAAFQNKGTALTDGNSSRTADADEKVNIAVAHGQQINCFGLLSRQNKLHFKTTTQCIDSNFLIAFFDEFVLKINKNTVIVLDNAKIHQSKSFKEQCNYWQEMGLFIVYLPPYSPHLNIIEKLWYEPQRRTA
jgi:DDE superfamily endonuclease